MPLNSRVTVNYGDSGTQPRVSFSYPRRCDSRIIWALRYVLPVLLVAWCIPLAILCTGLWFGAVFGVIAMMIINPPAVELLFNTLTPIMTHDAMSVFFAMLVGFVPVLASIGVAYNYERYAETFPKFMARHMSLYQMEIRELRGTSYTLPVFRNILLEYEATGDFGEQLRRITIREMPGVTKPGNKKWRNDVIWFARFEFKRKPRNGLLRLKFA
jgi:hypothetical protein